MGTFSKSKEKEELVLVFDIGSSSVGGALFFAQDSGFPKIIFSVREPIRVEKELKIERFLPLMIESLETVTNRIHQARLGAPVRIFCVLSSPWHISQTRTINFKKNTPFAFTAKLADSLMQKEISLLTEEHLARYTKTDNELRIIELKNIKTTLNGYETSKPLNQKAKELQMTVFISLGGESVLKTIEATIGKHLYSGPVKFASFTLSSFAVVRDMPMNREDFLLINVGGEVTDLSMVKRNVLRASASFPLGRNFLTRGVASRLSCSVSEASSLISVLKDGHGEKSITERLGKVVDGLRSEWLKQFEGSLSNLSTDLSIPSTIYLSADRDIAHFFAELIKIEQFNQYSLTESKFEIFLLSPQILHGLAELGKNVVPDHGMIIDAVYINRCLINPVSAGQA